LLKRAKQINIIGEDGSDNDLNLAISGLDDQQAKTVLHGFLQWTEGTSPNLGQRHPDDVIDRLLKKLRGSNEQQNLEKALQLVARLVSLKGTASDTLENTELILIESGAGPSALQSLQRLINLTADDSNLSSSIVLDFGLIKGMAYYSGLVFDIVHTPTSTILAGGGRYDSLAQDLGSNSSIPAAGFAYDLDALQGIIDPTSKRSITTTNDLFAWDECVLVIPQDIDSQAMALRVAQNFRDEGLLVEIGYQYKTVNEAMNHIDALTWTRVIMVGRSGIESSTETTTSGS
jgi:histidyl-tRNA synthetase